MIIIVAVMKGAITMKIMIVEKGATHTDGVEIMTEVIVEVIEGVKEVEKEDLATTMTCIIVTSVTAMSCTAMTTTDIHVMTPFSLMLDQIVWCRTKH
jgi:hypothetical protein